MQILIMWVKYVTAAAAAAWDSGFDHSGKLVQRPRHFSKWRQ